MSDSIEIVVKIVASTESNFKLEIKNFSNEVISGNKKCNRAQEKPQPKTNA